MNEQKISAAVSVAAQIAALPALPTTELWTLWDRYYPRRPENPNPGKDGITRSKLSAASPP